jgi:broad specificity phosphatase PhoE
MTRAALALILLATPACAAAQQGTAPPATAPTTVILVRHAEKASETETDPPLSERGRARAAALAHALRDARLTAVIVSERRRTQETAAPATPEGIVADTISIRDGVAGHARAVAARIRGRHAGGTVLVVGHSNTIPAVMTALGAGPLPDICDPAYANLYIMVLEGEARPRLVRATFGAPDPPGSEDCPGMQAR